MRRRFSTRSLRREVWLASLAVLLLACSGKPPSTQKDRTSDAPESGAPVAAGGRAWGARPGAIPDAPAGWEASSRAAGAVGNKEKQRNRATASPRAPSGTELAGGPAPGDARTRTHGAPEGGEPLPVPDLPEETGESSDSAPGVAGSSPSDGAARDTAGEPEDPAPVEIDQERGEVRIPCRFVNPQRQIEVFACHRQGPTHETVVEFDATGQQLYDALRALGCRPADGWVATSSGDFFRNQGDRLIVLVRWKWEGEDHELPAEALLVDGGLEYPSFVRGFSFSARQPPERNDADPQGGDGGPTQGSSKESFPRAVEISLGAAQRQRAVFSLLSHPTTLSGEGGGQGQLSSRALLPWLFFEPTINSNVLRDLQRLVEEQPPATLIFRRLGSEEELLAYRRSIAPLLGLGRRHELYDRLEGAARKIDKLKADYQRLADRIRRLLRTDLSILPEDLRPEVAAQGEALRRLGKWLCSRIQELYFTMYAEEERFKLEELRGLKDLDPKLLEMATTVTEDGLRFEPLLAAKEVMVRELAIRDLMAREEMRALDLERNQLIQKANMKDVESRMAELPPGNAYLRKLWSEEKMRLDVSARRLGALAELVATRQAELSAQLERRWEEVEETCARQRRAAEQVLKITGLEEELRGVLEKLRWAEEDEDSDDARRQREAKEKLPALRDERKKLEATLNAERRELEKLGATAQEGG